MKISLISTNGGINLDDPKYATFTEEEKQADILRQLILYCGRVARKCYSPLSWEEICAQSEDKAFERAKACLENKHHSIYDHAELTFSMSEIPKFMLMILNNEYCYTTSEQSARYTDFSKAGKTEKERELYTKWSGKIKAAILEYYGDKFTEAEAQKLAQENARYMISTFVETSIIHKLSLRQLNYELYYMEEFLKRDFSDCNGRMKKFVNMLKPYLEEFIQKMSPYKIEGLVPKSPRELAIFKNIHSPIDDIYDTTYKLSYTMSFAAFAQNQRHRTIRYNISLLGDKRQESAFYVPDIVEIYDMEREWLDDIFSVEDVFPQGMLIAVVETGEISDFISKCYERCCGRAQLEIQEVTNSNLDNFREYGTDAALKIIEKYIGEGSAACTFPCHKCTEGCKFGAKQRERYI